jgi:hypothetical protein
MYRLIVLGTVGLLAGGDLSMSPATEPAAAGALLNKAIAKRGDLAKQRKFLAFAAKGKGELFFQPITWEVRAHLPHCKRVVIHRTGEASEQGPQESLVNRDAGWVKVKGAVEEMPKVTLETEQLCLYAAYVATLLPLKDAKFTLKSLGETRLKIRGADTTEKPLAVGLLVSHPDRPDVRLYFDKNTLDLLKVEVSVKGVRRDLKAEMYLGNVKEISGVRVATTCSFWFDGLPIVALTVQELAPAANLDKTIFDGL